ncbi:glycoside hydrolase family 26 protein [Angustibacter aerolatus]
MVSLRVRARVARLVVAALLLTLLGALPGGGTAVASSASARAKALRASDTKSACLYSAHDLRRFRARERQARTTISCAGVYNDTAPTWATWQDPWFGHAPAAQPQYDWDGWVRGGTGRYLVITQSMVPAGASRSWRARGASGAYDAHIRALGRNLVRYGMGGSVIRLAPEANATWRFDSMGTTAAQRRDWLRYWRHFAKVLKSVPGSRFQLDWTVLAGVGVPLESIYPGDAAVDVVGVDVYDWASGWVGRRQPVRWTHQWRSATGLGEVVHLAARHRKPLGIGEWGLVPKRLREGAGDDPAFARELSRVVAAHVTRYQSYFDKDVGNTLSLDHAPRTRAVWAAMARASTARARARH